jgi:hypothetical protein
MIDKFNFYDIYGYFIPGAALLLLLWLPIGLTRGAAPPTDLGSAVIGAVVSYVVGHLLHMICTKAIPSTIVRDGKRRKPSDVVVDDTDTNFASEFKTQLAALVKKQFGLDIATNKIGDPAVDRVRGDAFNLARHALQHTKEVSYAEQLQGMYTLTRGLTACFATACAYYIGWASSVFHDGWVDCAVLVVITISLLTADNLTGMLWNRPDVALEKEEKRKEDNLKKSLENWSTGALLLAALAAGFLLGRYFQPTAMKAAILGFCAMGALLALFRCFMAYKSFSFSFATTVWRDFYSSVDKEKPPVPDPV